MTDATGFPPGPEERAARLLERLAAGGASAGRTGGASAAVGAGELVLVRAPGRVNLIGEHTDYNEGLVLPVAIDREIWIALQPWERQEVELTSLDLGQTASFPLAGLSPNPARRKSWIDYVAGTAWSMQAAGLPVRGFRGVLDSTVPVGSGLSSSAALEMASSWALAVPGTPRPDPAIMAAIAQRAENRYVGVNCGIMDQFASAAGRAGHALLIDCRTNTFVAAPMPADLSIVVCDTGSSRRLDSSAYNARRSECERGAGLIAEREPGVRSLRDVDPGMLARNREGLPEVVAMRCEHVVNENGRVLATVEAMREGDREALGRFFAASHASLRDLFQVSSPELDAMVGIATSVPGVVGARMTGAGFGGCTVNLVERGREEALRDAVMARYPGMTGLRPSVYAVTAVDGAGPLPDDRGIEGGTGSVRGYHGRVEGGA